MYKTYTGATMQEAVQQARLEHGDAVQLVDQKRRVVRRGPFGLFGREEWCEVIVNYDERGGRPARGREPRGTGHAEALEQVMRLAEQRRALGLAGAIDAQRSKAVPASDPELVNQLSELRGMLDNLTQQSALRRDERAPVAHGGLDPVRRFLEKNDFEKYFAERIVDALASALSVKELSDDDAVRAKLEELLLAEVHPSGPLATDGFPRLVALVGPTGVGKTTTVAKIAAALTFNEQRKVALLTVDNYRIAAQEQISKYAEIMSLPVQAVAHKEQLEQAIARTRADVFMLDTAGRNQKKELEIGEVKSYLAAVKIPVDVCLVVSATTKYADLVEIMERFEATGYDKVIVTKVDETNTFGSVISALAEKGKRLAYVCTGQRVPDDIKIAERQDLVSRVMLRYPVQVAAGIR